MKALITGASSGLGKEFALILSEMGYDIIAVARRTDKLLELKNSLKTEVTVITADLSDRQCCFDLFEKAKDADILINNAGFGECGSFEATDLQKELLMAELNISALYLLTKLFYNEFSRKNKGYILNVASIAGIMPGGAYMAQYYATKAYVLSLSRSLYQEGKSKGVKVCALCPGPVDTEFNQNANVSFALKGANPSAVAKYAIKKMFSGKHTIVPVITIKLCALAARLCPTRLMLKITSKIQESKLQQ